jgi:MFS family permease
VDRWDRKRIMVAASLLQAMAVSLLLLVQADEWLWLVYVVAFAQSVIAAFFGPAESALLPRLVGEEHLLQANSLNALNNNLARLAGPAIGGLILGVFGLPAVVLLDGASFMVGALMISLVVVPPGPVGEQAPLTDAAGSAWTGFWREWLDGLGLVRRERSVAVLFVAFGLMTFGGVMIDPLFPAFVDEVLRSGAQAFGWLLTAQALGGIVGGMSVGWFGVKVRPKRLVAWGSMAASMLLLIQFNIPSLPLALAISFLVGIPATASGAGVQTLVQTSVRDEYRGRVFGALGASGSFWSLVGASVGGALGETAGIVPILNLALALTIVAGIVVLALLPGTAPGHSVASDAPATRT